MTTSEECYTHSLVKDGPIFEKRDEILYKTLNSIYSFIRQIL